MIGKEQKKYCDRTDDDLLELLSQRNTNAFRELYIRYWDILYVRAHNVLRDEKACEDIVQEVFIDLWERKSYDQIRNFSAWINQAVRYKTLMVLRKNNISDRHLEVFKSLTIHYQNPIQEFRLKELEKEIVSQMANLPPRCREVFYKSRFENLENQEIADQLNISKRTVETHISHALRYLKGVREFLVFVLCFFL